MGDRVEVELFVGGEAWLERLLLRLGPDARVVGPPEYRSLAAEAAARILRLYGSADAGSADAGSADVESTGTENTEN